jgi:prolyl oligopeptidase
MKEIKSLLAATLATLLAASGAAWSADGPPVAPVRPVTDTYFGTLVIDNYRYMENLSDPEVQNWMKAQAVYTRKVLDEIPGHAAMAQRIAELMGKDLLRYDFSRRGDRLFYRMIDGNLC